MVGLVVEAVSTWTLSDLGSGPLSQSMYAER